MTTTSEFDRAVANADGITALALVLGESPQTVTNWRPRGVPPSKTLAFCAATGTSPKLIRPNDWMDYWPHLAESAAA